MTVAGWRARIAGQDAALAERYWARDAIEAIVADRVAFFDGIVREIWDSHFDGAAGATRCCCSPWGDTPAGSCTPAPTSTS